MFNAQCSMLNLKRVHHGRIRSMIRYAMRVPYTALGIISTIKSLRETIFETKTPVGNIVIHHQGDGVHTIYICPCTY